MFFRAINLVFRKDAPLLPRGLPSPFKRSLSTCRSGPVLSQSEIFTYGLVLFYQGFERAIHLPIRLTSQPIKAVLALHPGTIPDQSGPCLTKLGIFFPFAISQATYSASSPAFSLPCLSPFPSLLPLSTLYFIHSYFYRLLHLLMIISNLLSLFSPSSPALFPLILPLNQIYPFHFHCLLFCFFPFSYLWICINMRFSFICPFFRSIFSHIFSVFLFIALSLFLQNIQVIEEIMDGSTQVNVAPWWRTSPSSRSN